MELKQSKDVCIDKLTSTRGEDLEITANLTSANQFNAILEGYVAGALNSKFGLEESWLKLRLTCAFRGRCRDDLTGIGKVPEVQGWQQGGGEL